MVGAELQRRILRVHARAVQLCPVNTGRLRSSIRWAISHSSKGLVGTVGTDVDYALFVHEGTRPHVIEARDAQALYWKGAAHPVVRVNHPGTRAVPFLLNALQEVAG